MKDLLKMALFSFDFTLISIFSDQSCTFGHLSVNDMSLVYWFPNFKTTSDDYGDPFKSCCILKSISLIRDSPALYFLFDPKSVIARN